MTAPKCAFCSTELKHTFVDLGMAPMVSAYLNDEKLTDVEHFYPMRAYTCDQCFLVQLPQAQTPSEIFGDYPYFSSMSSSWLKHAENFANFAVDKFGLNKDSKVIEVASNDGYLLQFFQQHNIEVLGVEPAANIAKVANEKGIPTVSKFFGEATALEVSKDGQADLIAGNNVLAHVPDLNDFVKGLQTLLKPGGSISVEFPHLLKTIEENQFDQVFHEHFSYLSLFTVNKIFSKYGLQIFHVDELPTHGGSIRVAAQHAATGQMPVDDSVATVMDKEMAMGLDSIDVYLEFSKQAVDTKLKLLATLLEIKNSGKSIIGYGAPGKGCTMLNYCGIRSDFLDYLVDISPAKQNLYMPGVHLPIYHPDKIKETKPDYILILPWNLSKEIMQQLEFVRSWGGQFIIPIPESRIV